MVQQRDEVGRSGIYPPGVPTPDDVEVITPGEINEGHTGRHREQESLVPVNREDKSEAPGAERLPRKGDELDDMSGQPTD